MENLAKYIDHTLLKATAKKEDIKKLCLEAKEYHFASVCVNPCYVGYCHALLKDSDVKVCTVIGFPLGANTPTTKCQEAQEAVRLGAQEVDMVINIADAKDGNFKAIEEEIALVKKASYPALLKVILETCYLSDEEIVQACKAAKAAKADFVKTSTGFGTGGATTHHVELMRKTVGPDMGVKASGGVRSKEDALDMIKAGATRIGTSNGLAIVV